MEKQYDSGVMTTLFYLKLYKMFYKKIFNIY